MLAAICVMFADESPLYNISKGNFDKAFKFYKRIATSNGLKLSESWKKKLKINSQVREVCSRGFWPTGRCPGSAGR